MTKQRIVYVHAFEYVNPGPSAGGGGFDWFREKADAVKAFTTGTDNKSLDTADFYFEAAISPRLKPEAVTEFIDADLHDYCAKAKDRRVGMNVLKYWRNNKMKMGGAKRPARV